MSSPRCASLHPSRRWQCVLRDQHDSTYHVAADSTTGWTDAQVDTEKLAGTDLPFPHVRIAVSGARKFEISKHRELVGGVLETLIARHRGIVLITGGAVGLDAYAARWGFQSALRKQVRVHTVLPADHKQVDPDWQNCCDTFEQMPDFTTYQHRNERMVNLCDWFYAWPFMSLYEMGKYKGGTWRAIDYALAMHKTTPSCISVLERVKTLN
jgi:hypothetical protein